MIRPARYNYKKSKILKVKNFLNSERDDNQTAIFLAYFSCFFGIASHFWRFWINGKIWKLFFWIQFLSFWNPLLFVANFAFLYRALLSKTQKKHLVFP